MFLKWQLANVPNTSSVIAMALICIFQMNGQDAGVVLISGADVEINQEGGWL